MILELNPSEVTYRSQEIINFILSMGNYEFYKIRYFGLLKLNNFDLHNTTDVVCMIPSLHKKRFNNIKIRCE
jgi:hypothetical protein